LDSNGITYYTAGVPNFTGNATDGALYSQAYSSSWQHQIAADYRSGQIALRGKNSGTWQSWRTVLDSSNYTSYAPSLTGSGASGNWGINITGSAATLTTARTISLGGDVTGSASFNGSADITITATIAANSVALGTDTTGNYVAGLTQGNGISITGTAGEGWSPTVAMTGSYTGTFTATGDVCAYSDVTLKDNIEIISDPLTKVLKLRGVTFTRKDLDDNKTHMGVIAQEVEEVIPEVVITNEDGIKTVAYGNMVGLLIEAVKELTVQNKELAERVAQLESKLNG
jgi:hypothetical protein